MLSRDEFHRVMADNARYMDGFIESPRDHSMDDFFDRGMSMVRTAVHIPEGEVDERGFDNRLGIFRLGECLVEGSFLPDMARMGGAVDDQRVLTSMALHKIRGCYRPADFEGNDYVERQPFPNIHIGMQFAVEFFKLAPTIDFTKAPKPIVSVALSTDLLKVTTMITWGAALSSENGLDVGDVRGNLRKVYSIKYGAVMCNWDPSKVRDVCEQVLPWVEELKRMTVGEKTEKYCLN